MNRLALGCVLLLAFASGCNFGSAGSFAGVDITGADYGKELALTDHAGRARTLADFRGKVVVVFFGYTHCPDVCPTTLADLAQTLKLLGKQSESVQVLFVTLDPARDDVALLARYVPSFDATFLGLRGDDAATRKAAKSFRVFFEKRPGKTAQDYTLDHTAGVFVIDREGRTRLFFTLGMRPEQMAADLRLLLRQ
jgi:protein SCO1